MKENNTTYENYYDKNAKDFFSQTVQADMTPHYDAFLENIPKGGSILDAGCGSGRDSAAFKALGYQVTAMDASREMCKLSSEYLGQPTLHKTFQEIDFVETFNGIWACASLLHVPSDELADAINKLAVSLKKDGVLFASFKYGTFEGDRNGRNFFDLNEETAKAYFNTSKLEIMKLWLTQDVRPDRNDEYWMNILACKLG